MIITALAVMCHVLSPSNLGTADEPKCEPVVITDSVRMPELTFLGCMMSSQAAIAQWKMNHPVYSSDQWQVAKVACIVTDKPLDVERET